VVVWHVLGRSMGCKGLDILVHHFDVVITLHTGAVVVHAHVLLLADGTDGAVKAAILGSGYHDCV
jgi:hypothetical protein